MRLAPASRSHLGPADADPTRSARIDRGLPARRHPRDRRRLPPRHRPRPLQGRHHPRHHRARPIHPRRPGSPRSPTTTSSPRPTANQLAIEYRGLTAEIPVTVKDAATPRPISFQLDVMPVLTASGCNTGSCHGSARGQDGFMLSLFGYDPKGDHHRLTREFAGRRVNLAAPGGIAADHQGGRERPAHRRQTDSKPAARHSTRPSSSGSVPAPLRRRRHPRKPIGIDDRSGPGRPQGCRAHAAPVHRPRHLLRRHRPRRHHPDHLPHQQRQPRSIIEPTAWSPPPRTAARPSSSPASTPSPRARRHRHPGRPRLRPAPRSPANNYIDTHVHEKLHKLRIIPSELCSDEVFLRRAYHRHRRPAPHRGRVAPPSSPTPDPDKRDQTRRRAAIAQGVHRDVGDEMGRAAPDPHRPANNQVSYKAALLYYDWLQANASPTTSRSTRSSSELLSTGRHLQQPRHQLLPDRDRTSSRLTENVAQVFMGMRIQCAQCHNHPFDRWTMDDYYGFAAFFAQVERKPAEDPRETIIFDRRRRRETPGHQADMARASSAAPAPEIANGTDRREAVAEVARLAGQPVVRPQRRQHHLGPLLRRRHHRSRSMTSASPTPPPTPSCSTPSPRSSPNTTTTSRLVRDICTSRTYQLETRPTNPTRPTRSNFSHAPIRRMRAEVLLDALARSPTPRTSSRASRSAPAPSRSPTATPPTTSSPPSAAPPAPPSAPAR